MPALLLSLLAASAAAASDLTVFDAVVGSCFTGKVGEGAIDTHCFEKIDDATHIRDRHQVVAGGKVVYSGETIYSRKQGKLTFIYRNSTGGVGHGTAAPDKDGICFSGEMRADPDSAEQHLASCWRWAAGGDYLAVPPSGEAVRFSRVITEVF